MLKYKCRPTAARDQIGAMASAVLTISQAVETASDNRTTNPSTDEQLAAPYQLYMQCRQRQSSRCCNPKIVLNLCRGVLARLLLILLAIYLYSTAYCIDEQQNRAMLYLSFSLILIVAEGTIAIWYKNGEHEWYWFSPCIFIFILIGLPPIWIIRFHEWSAAKSGGSTADLSIILATDATQFLQNTTISDSACRKFTEFLETYSGFSFGEQLLTICIVLVRWLLPVSYNSHINRFVYLEMLLFNVAIVSDIFEFTENVLSNRHLQVKNGQPLNIASMVSYSMSLFLFTMNFKAKKKHTSSKLRFVLWPYATTYQRLSIILDFFTSTEIWSCLIILFTLDLPFLIYRLIIICIYHDRNFVMIFFIVKNFMLILIDGKLIYGYIHEYKSQRFRLHINSPEQITI